MKNAYLLSLALVLLLLSFASNAAGQSNENEAKNDTTEISNDEKLVIVWTSGDKEVAMKMVFMYAFNAKKYEWWKDITLLIWGPSAKLLSEDADLQEYVQKMSESGIHLLACKACADQYNVAEKLEQIGVTVRYTGVDLTNFIKERHVVTF